MYKTIEEIMQQLNEEEMQHLEAFACAYLKMTNIHPDNAVLVKIQEAKDGIVTTNWFYRKKTKEET